MAPQECWNVLNPQLSRYINRRSDIEAYLTAKYGPGTEFNMVDFSVVYENDRWSFTTPEKLSKKQIKDMTSEIIISTEIAAQAKHNDLQVPRAMAEPSPQSRGAAENVSKNQQALRVMVDILEELQSAMKRPEKPEKSYVCYDDLKVVWKDKSRISTIIRLDNSSDMYNRIEFIQTNMIVTLSTLIWIRATDCLAAFTSTFFGRDTGDVIFSDMDIPCFNQDKIKLQLLGLRPELEWLFYENQFIFKPVNIEIESSQTIQKIHSKQRLPFESLEKHIGGGGFGRVDRVGISPKYIRQGEPGRKWSSEKVYMVACKKITAPKDFAQEIENLQILKDSLTSHGRIVTHLASIEHGAKRYILLPLAAYGDLEMFLHSGVRPGRSKIYDFDLRFKDTRGIELAFPLLDECFAIASALEWLHNHIKIKKGAGTVNLFCAHLDLKPANILIQADSNSPVGKWVLSDFSISVIKEGTRGQDSNYGSIGDYVSQLTVNFPRRQEGTYQAPEVKLYAKNLNQPSYIAPDQKDIERKSDIWSFGCILSEVIAFSLGRDKFVGEFSNARKTGERDDYFYSEVRGTMSMIDIIPSSGVYEVRPAVNAWLDRLCTGEARPQRWVDCCVGTIKKILIVDFQARPDATDLLSLLKHLKDHLRYSKDNAWIPCPILNPIEQMERPLEQAPTDSGYASGTHEEQLKELDTSGTNYSASETSSLLPLRDKSFIDDLAAELFSTIKLSSESERATLERISEKLPDLLRSFALKIGYKPHTPMHRDVSYFVQKYRGRIKGSFEDMFPLEDLAPELPSHNDRFQLSQFAIDRFLEEVDPNVDQQTPEEHITEEPEADEEEDDDDEVDGEEKLDSSPYREFILKTPAYEWLLTSLQREVALKRANPDLMENIGRAVLGALPSYRKNVSRKIPSQEYEAMFELEWDPLSFVKEQKYTESPDEALERAITLTGTANDAQAVTTKEYLIQTWPATGTHVMRLVTDLVRVPYRRAGATVNLPDGTEIDAWFKGSLFIVRATGTGDSLAEIAQQFAWLGAALRSSPFESGVAICSPLVLSSKVQTIPPARVSEGTPLARIQFLIKFHMNNQSKDTEKMSGHCWHSMLKNPVMVNGYPILAKHEQGLGLEIPLNMVARLAESERANMFDGKLFIKGFSAMLIATKLTRDILIWHYFYNRKGDRISYLDHTLQGVDDINLLQLDTARHIVGWCADCRYYAGASDARYDMDTTGLPRPHAGCLLEKVSISAGKIVTAGMSFAVGVKDIPPHLTHNGYIPKMRWIATKHVVLWDEADKRGWLVNGISALLHLVRTSLEHYSNDDFSTSFLFDYSKMRDASDHKPNSAHKVLIDDENKGIVIWPGKNENFEEEETKQKGPETEQSKSSKKKRGYYLFEDLVEQHYNTLEQIMEYQRHIMGQNGVKIKVRVRKHLEGWDFVELATDHDPYPRVATLHALGYGWVDFIRSIEAITLFGRGFGDIIRPIEFKGMCPNWQSLPTQKYYLAASVFDLEKIMKKFGDIRADPVRLCSSLVWHCPGDIVSPCRCQAHGIGQVFRKASSRHHDPVQVLYPRMSRLIKPRGPERLEGGGAIVFGHNFHWGYRWKEDGNEDLEEGDPPILSSTSKPRLLISRVPPSSGSSERQASQSTTSESSQSHESAAGRALHSFPLRSSPSAYTAQSTPNESIIDSAEEVTSDVLEPAYNVDRSGQLKVLQESRTRTLRHELRHLHKEKDTGPKI
ncbi:uncharacterized protein PAC_10595 [Phialocephala subalpina]|uniref:non-specific serine/threonine protein kinase n=1 Tax=Phialocephala subalpina TaxID=576137 RepID=A0A1L7X6P8_9HELO|nr:uncharacterized protein PAC_10595 [Phialocephala subalpina]